MEKFTKFVVNGVEYRSLGEMPPEIRALFDEDGNIADRGMLAEKHMILRSYNINGKEYKSLEEMPAELRALFEDKDNDGVPDIVQHPFKMAAKLILSRSDSPAKLEASFTPGGNSRFWRGVLIGIAAALLIAVLGIALGQYFFGDGDVLPRILEWFGNQPAAPKS